MKTLRQVVHWWLTTIHPSNHWYVGDQVVTVPKPQDAPFFGFYVIGSRKNLSFGEIKNTYDPDIDKFITKITKTFTVPVKIDIYSQNTAIAETDAEYLSGILEVSILRRDIQEYFTANNVKFLKFNMSENFSYSESSQTRKRWHLECLFNIVITINTEVDRVVSAPFNLDLTN